MRISRFLRGESKRNSIEWTYEEEQFIQAAVDRHKKELRERAIDDEICRRIYEHEYGWCAFWHRYIKPLLIHRNP